MLGFHRVKRTFIPSPHPKLCHADRRIGLVIVKYSNQGILVTNLLSLLSNASSDIAEFASTLSRSREDVHVGTV